MDLFLRIPANTAQHRYLHRTATASFLLSDPHFPAIVVDILNLLASTSHSSETKNVIGMIPEDAIPSTSSKPPGDEDESDKSNRRQSDEIAERTPQSDSSNRRQSDDSIAERTPQSEKSNGIRQSDEIIAERMPQSDKSNGIRQSDEIIAERTPQSDSSNRRQSDDSIAERTPQSDKSSGIRQLDETVAERMPQSDSSNGIRRSDEIIAERTPQVADFAKHSLSAQFQSKISAGEITFRPAEEIASGHLMKHKVAPLLRHVTTPPISKSSLIQGSVSKEAAIATHARISSEKEQTLRELYDRLDMDNDGTIDIRDLTSALQHQMPHIPSSYAPRLIARMTKNNRINFAEFVLYVLDHEKQLELVFQDLDRNKDGFIDVKEIKDYCSDLGITISDSKARNIVERIHDVAEMHPDGMRMDQTGSAAIDLSEFQQFMLFYPSTDPKDIADFWRHNLVIDIGEDSQVPEDFSPQEIQSGVWWRHLVAGGMAGCMSRTCTAPLDRIKVFLQVYATGENRMNLGVAVRALYREGGMLGFWRGNGMNVVKIAPESALKFMAYEHIKRIIKKAKGDAQLNIYERFLAGSSAGAISQTVIYPMEVLKTRLALRRTGELKGVFDFVKNLYRSEGATCFYKGYVPNLMGIIPYAGIDLAIYETLKGLYREHSKEPGVLAVLACGTCSSTCGQLATYPLALVRTRLQARSGKRPDQPASMTGQFRHIYQHEGLRGLYRGIAPNFLKVVPAVSISYVVYESVRKHLGATMS